MVDVEEGALGALEEDRLLVADRVVEDLRDVADERGEGEGGLDGGLDLLGVRGRRVVAAQELAERAGW